MSLMSRGVGCLTPREPQEYSGIVTSTTTVLTPVAPSRILVASIYFSNNSAFDCISIGLRFGATGTVHYNTYLPAYGGTVFLNLVECEFSVGGGGVPLQIVVDVTNSPSVMVTIGYFLLHV